MKPAHATEPPFAGLAGDPQDGTPPPDHGVPVQSSRRRHWLSLFLGRVISRVCPSVPAIGECTGCRLRALCKCAQDDFLAAARVENRVWAVVAACAVVILLYALGHFLLPG